MTRRDFVRAGAAGLASFGFAGSALGRLTEPSLAAAHRVPLITGWRFGGRYMDGSTEPAFDDSGFEEVSLPHCVATLDWSNWDPAAWEDVFIYRRKIEIPPELASMRLFLDFEGSLTGTTPTINGHQLEQHLGGYLPFSYEVTGLVREGTNVLAVVVDGRFLNVPPNGSPAGTIAVDYLQPGGLYREVCLRAVPQTFLGDVFAKPTNVLDAARRGLVVESTIDAAAAVDAGARVVVELREGDRVVSRATKDVTRAEAGETRVEMTLTDLESISLWDLDHPQLYDVVAELSINRQPVHTYRTRTGFREARFEENGFFLNGRRVELLGLNRHQTYPYTGHAMPRRVQRADALLLKNELNCNMVRCSHYPQSTHFMDACDEIGLLTWVEIPGWQFIGDAQMQRLIKRDTEVMVRRDRNRPSVATWGVRINESPNAPQLYQETKRIARELDDSRPTTGAMVGWLRSTDDFHQDLFSFNDYGRNEQGADIRPPLPGVPYLVTEAIGSLTGAPLYRRTDPMDVQRLQSFLHAQAHHQVGIDERHCGLLAWSAIDYQSINGGNRIYRTLKWNGVCDTFRVPKLGAAIYQSQIDPAKRPVIAPAFYWNFDEPSPDGPGADAMICSNCDRLEIYIDEKHHATATPDRDRFGGLAYPPFFVDLAVDGAAKPTLRIDGFVGDEKVLTRSFASDPAADKLLLRADDTALTADGADATRVVFRVVDQHDAPRPYVGGTVTFSLEGPAVLVGQNPFDLAETGGVAAVWVKTIADQAGRVRLTATHPRYGAPSVEIQTHT